MGHYKIAATNTNGVSAYFINDAWGRPTFSFDQDHNIVQKNSYLTAIDAASFASPTIVFNGVTAPVNGMPATFSISGPNDCAAAGTSVTWNFGDGTIVTSPGLISPSHTYTGLSSETVTATVNSPLLGTKTPPPLVFTVLPQSIPIVYTTFTTGHGDISSVTFTPIGPGNPYSFNNTNLNGAHVQQGNYTVVVTLAGGQQYNPSTGTGYNSVQLISGTGTCYKACQNWNIDNTYTFSVNITNCTVLSFNVYQVVCNPEE